MPSRRPSNAAEPPRRRDEADDRLEQHGLAAAALADDGQRLPARDAEVDVAQHLLPPEADVEVVAHR